MSKSIGASIIPSGQIEVLGPQHTSVPSCNRRSYKTAVSKFVKHHNEI